MLQRLKEIKKYEKKQFRAKIIKEEKDAISDIVTLAKLTKSDLK